LNDLLVNVDAFIFDFDGVLTDNLVYVDQRGVESVCCSRSDGLAFDFLRSINKPVYIISTEKNYVVKARGKKLGVPVIQGVSQKVNAINDLAKNHGYSIANMCFVGNDINDYHAMRMCGISACPADSNPIIISIATVKLEAVGGRGVARELIEKYFKVDLLAELFGK
jgi:YrbI family 3-deoxy-D-manno-octulosonate 8-phosphate phosphatase